MRRAEARLANCSARGEWHVGRPEVHDVRGLHQRDSLRRHPVDHVRVRLRAPLRVAPTSHGQLHWRPARRSGPQLGVGGYPDRRRRVALRGAVHTRAFTLGARAPGAHGAGRRPNRWRLGRFRKGSPETSVCTIRPRVERFGACHEAEVMLIRRQHVAPGGHVAKVMLHAGCPVQRLMRVSLPKVLRVHLDVASFTWITMPVHMPLGI
mmetsp:Transcript_11846/g.31265  ORF Transcript_11846/g.31265 Transcript_11846/m.31265 type:complete len:208 (-) Transcript_11846:120-743(-)